VQTDGDEEQRQEARGLWEIGQCASHEEQCWGEYDTGFQAIGEPADGQ
jgi:hypothetical protein